MKRRYDVELYELKIRKIKDKIPNCCIGVDVIVGFPSESESDFLKTYHLLNNLDISYLHVFSYSEREKTKAILINNKVPNLIKQNRRKVLTSLSDDKKTKFINSNMNKNYNVLFETYEEGYVNGFTENYIKVYVKGNKELINQVHPVKLTDYSSSLVLGELIHWMML